MVDILSRARAVLTTTPDRWIQLINTLPMELLTRRPAEGEWSAVECLLHLIDTERAVFPTRVEYLLQGRDFPAFDPDTEGTKPGPEIFLTQLAQEFARLREGSLDLFNRVTEADLQRQASHSELGMVTMAELLHEWAAHDLMHTVQAEQALMQPFIAGCGPWQPYFKDHFVGPMNE